MQRAAAGGERRPAGLTCGAAAGRSPVPPRAWPQVSTHGNSGSGPSTLAVPARGSSGRLAAKALAAAKAVGLSSGGSTPAR